MGGQRGFHKTAFSSHSISRDTELIVLADRIKQEMQTDLAEIIVNQSSKSFHDLIDNTYKMYDISSVIERENKSHLEFMHKAFTGECAKGCMRQWVGSACEFLVQNQVNAFVYGASLQDLLKRGSGTFRKLLIIGQSNSDKTFLLKPPEVIFRDFIHSANDILA